MNYSINCHKVVLVGSAGVMYNSHVTYPQPLAKHDVLKKLFLFEIYQNTQKWFGGGSWGWEELLPFFVTEAT